MSAKKPTPPVPTRGRPKNPPHAALKPVPGLGIRLSVDKVQKLERIVARSYGRISAREWIEGAIEQEYVRMQQRKVAS